MKKIVLGLPTIILAGCATAAAFGAENIPEYDRDAFADYDRQESLDYHMTETDQWFGYYSGEVISDSSLLDIDHVISLKWAWDNGAWEWAQEKRDRIATDFRNLIPVHQSENRSKGALGPDEWLPSHEPYRCAYVMQFAYLALEYELITMTHPMIAVALNVCLNPLNEEEGPETDPLALYDTNGNGRISCAEAREHGIAPVYDPARYPDTGNPAYNYMDDRDNDGVVCE